MKRKDLLLLTFLLSQTVPVLAMIDEEILPCPSTFNQVVPNGSIEGALLAQKGQRLVVGAHVAQSVSIDNVNDISSTATIGQNLQVSNFEQATLNGAIEGNLIAQMGQRLVVGAHVAQSVSIDNVNDISSTATIGQNLQVSNFEQATLNGAIEGNLIAQMGQRLVVGGHVVQSVITDHVNDVFSTATISQDLQVSNLGQAILNGSIESNIIAQMGQQLNVGGHVSQSVIADNVNK